ncbi:hypothetical protein MKW92_008018 [Papaver armeniacum]|nr:hypothetical protein MKW92_008018 [Papaver armeniacum]
MRSHLFMDTIAKIFSFLLPDSLACAASVCKQWHTCATTYVITRKTGCHSLWFLGMPLRNRGFFCYMYNATLERWYVLSLEFIRSPVLPIAPIGSLILYRSATQPAIQLAICNPFTKQNWLLPPLIASGINPAVGVIGWDASENMSFRIFVAGGMSGNNSYEPTLEIQGSMPIEFSVRITVWTPNESVYSKGVLYWITSARELNVPMANQLEFASIVYAWIWELGIEDKWVLVERVPSLLGKKFWGSKRSWSKTKCVGSDEAVYLYREFGRESSGKGRWEWFWIEGCGFIKGEKVLKFPIKGMLFQPSLNPSLFTL